MAGSDVFGENVAGGLRAYRVKDLVTWPARFKEVLAGMGVVVPDGCRFAQELLSFERCLRMFLPDPKVPRDWDVQEIIRDATCVFQLLELTLKRKSMQGFNERFAKHYKLLTDASTRQAAQTGIEDQGNRKVFELVCALAIMGLTTEVELEDPDSSTGENPDVIAKVDGRRWGIACKVVHSANPQTVSANIQKGMRQIERSNADIGIVVLSLKNLVRPDLVLPMTRSDQGIVLHGQTAGSVRAYLLRVISELHRPIRASIPPEVLRDPPKAVKALPMVLWLAPAVTAVSHAADVRPSLMVRSACLPAPMRGEISFDEEAVKSFLKRFHAQLVT